MMFLTDAMINLIGFGLKLSGIVILSYPVLLLSGFAIQKYVNSKNTMAESDGLAS